LTIRILETQNLGILGRLSLAVVEVSGNSDDCLGDRLTEIVLRRLLHLLEDHRGDLRRRVLLPFDVDPCVSVGGLHDLERHHLHLFTDFARAASHEAFDGEDGVLGVGDGLTLGHLAHKPLTALAERHNRGVVRPPLALVMTTGLPPSITATTEFVVPKSIPMILLIFCPSSRPG
jgi:hypothetical protein